MPITRLTIWSSAVNVNSTPKVQYAYTEMSAGANHSRLTSMTYVDWYVENDSSGFNEAISRLSSLSDANNKCSGTACPLIIAFTSD